MANQHQTLTNLFDDIAYAIRYKTGQTGAIVADNFPAAIHGIDTCPDDALFLKTKNAFLSHSNSDPRIDYCNDRFIVREHLSNYYQYSPDGMAWIATSFSSANGLVSPTYYYGGNYIMTRAQSTAYYYSTDLLGWSSGTLPFTSYAPIPMVYDGSKYVTVSAGTSDGSNVAAYSFDLVNWSTPSLPATLRWSDVAYGNGAFVAVGYQYTSYTATASRTYAYSTDGLTWVSRSLPTDARWGYITFGNGKFVAVTNNGDQVACSPDGLTWTLSTLPLATSWRKVVYGNGVYVATPSKSSTYAYSYDGVTWHQGSLPASESWLSIAFGDGKFVAVATNSFTVAISYNGVDWDTKTDFIADTSDKNVTRETVLALDELDTARFLTDVEGYETVPVVVEQETSHNADMSVESGAVTGTYLVTVDGIEYVCDLYSDDQSAMSLGDSRLERSDMSNPIDVPFKAVFWYNESWLGDSELLCYLAFSDAGTHTVKIDRITGTVKKAALLDKKGADVADETASATGFLDPELKDQDSLISQISAAIDNKSAEYPSPIFKVDEMSGSALGIRGYKGSSVSQSITTSWSDIHTISNASTYSKPFWCVLSESFGAGVITEYDKELSLLRWDNGRPMCHSFRVIVDSDTIKFQAKATVNTSAGVLAIYGALK